MWLRKGMLWAGVCLCLVPLAYASGILSPIRPGDLREMARGRYQLASLLVGCELDNQCMQASLTELVKHDPHPLYEEYLQALNQQQIRVDYEAKKCRTPASKAYRQGISVCLAGMLDSIDPKVGLNDEQKQKFAAPLKACILKNVTQLAKAGNLYAQTALMQRALQAKNEPEFALWYQKIELQRASREYDVYQYCREPLQMFDIFVNEEQHGP